MAKSFTIGTVAIRPMAAAIAMAVAFTLYASDAMAQANNPCAADGHAALETKLDAIEAKVDMLEAKLDAIDVKIDTGHQDTCTGRSICGGQCFTAAGAPGVCNSVDLNNNPCLPSMGSGCTCVENPPVSLILPLQ